MPKEFPVSWDEMHRLSKALAWRLQEVGKTKGEWKGIIAVTRGGLIPAGIVAVEADIRLIETVSVRSYHDDRSQSSECVILKEASFAGDGTGWIVIDDLADTGNTFRTLRKILPNAHYACPFVKPQGAPTVDTFLTEVSQDTWILLPWDLEPAPQK